MIYESDKKTVAYLLQYSATGALFYSFYENSREQFCVWNCLLPPGNVQIKAKDGIVYGNCNLWEQNSGFERIIRDSDGKMAASLSKCSDNEYVLRDIDGELFILLEKDCFCGKLEDTIIFMAQKIDDLHGLKKNYEQQGYDVTYGYKVLFLKPMTETRKMWVGSFPMLHM